MSARYNLSVAYNRVCLCVNWMGKSFYKSVRVKYRVKVYSTNGVVVIKCILYSPT